jgi:general secretion pathway protein A
MYEAFYGLRERPFELTADPRFLFLSNDHREALSNLEFGIMSRKGITLLVGDAGLGKTMMIRTLLGVKRPNALCLFISNPTLTRTEFVRMVATGFDLSAEAAVDKVLCLRELEPKLLARAANGEPTALIIDEAQSLSYELLEEIRLLTNLETAEEKLLPLVLVGQPELADRLNETSLRQLKQRIALRCQLKPFALEGTAAYMATRIRAAGGKAAELFTREAVGTIHDASRGILRTISVLCDNALLSGYALGQRPVRRALVEEVCRDFDTTPQASPAIKTVAPTAPPVGTEGGGSEPLQRTVTDNVRVSADMSGRSSNTNRSVQCI